MIKGITSTSRYITVTGGMSTDPYISPGAAGAGMVRWNPNMNCMEVNDGNSWKTLSMNYAAIEVTPELESLLDWARRKRDEEMVWQSLAKDNQAVKIALDNLEQAKRQLDVTAKLAREYDTETTS
jgi:uncharacterized protein YqfA (UPF0365 family)